MSLREEERHIRKNSFFHQRLQTCGYRFYEMLQTRTKEIPKLLGKEEDFALVHDVRAKVLGASDRYINCLRGEHYTDEIPEYIFNAAQSFKSHYFTRLAPRFILEDERLNVLEAIFTEMDPN